MCNLVLVLAVLFAATSPPQEDLAKLASTDPKERLSAARALAKLGTLEAVQAVAPLLADANPRVRRLTAEALGDDVKDGAARQWVVEDLLAYKKDPRVRAGAATVLGRWGAATYKDAILGSAADSDASVRATAIAVLSTIGKKAPQEAFAEALKDAAWEVRVAALDAMAATDPPAAQAAAAGLAGDADYQVRVARLDLMVAGAVDVARPALISGLKDQAWQVAATAAHGLTFAPHKDAVVPLIDALEKADGRMRQDFADALERITGEENGQDVAAWRQWWRHNEETYVAPKPGGDRGQHTVVDGFYGIPVVSKRVVFVLDVTGGMARPADGGKETRLDRARSELSKVLQRFTEDVRFNCIFLSTEPRALSDRLVPAKRSNVAAAFDLARKQFPGGRTNLFDALAKAFDDPDVDTVYLLSEGAPNEGTWFNKAEILAEVRSMNRFRRIRVHTIEVGEAPKTWVGFLDELAEATAGQHIKS